MRVLAIVCAVLVGGCYSPNVDDCQFRCTLATGCPDGTRCVNGFCRTGTTGSCASPTDSATDQCPVGTPNSPSDCTKRFAIIGGCGVVCGTSGGEERSWADAQMSCTGAGWQIAVLPNLADLNATALTSNERAWVGARRPSTFWQWEDNTVVQMAAWEAGAAPIAGDTCALIEGDTKRLTNVVSCGETERYICTYPPRN